MSDPPLVKFGLHLAGLTHPLLAQHADVVYAPYKGAQYAEACDWMHLFIASDAGGERFNCPNAAGGVDVNLGPSPGNKQRKEGQVLFAIELMICRFEGRDLVPALQACIPKQLNRALHQ